jgi:hypothetical protein
VNLYGFNFTTTNVSIAVVNQNGTKATPPPGYFTVPSEFMATFNIVTYPFTSANQYVSFTLSSGDKRTVSIIQDPTCGSVGQPCCTGGVCVTMAGCMSGTCQTCPPVSSPTVQEFARESSIYCGSNCGGQHNVVRTYGGMCNTGFTLQQCSLSVNSSCGAGCSAVAAPVNPGNPKDCTCNITFNTPNDCFKGINVSLVIDEVSIPPARPAGCP